MESDPKLAEAERLMNDDQFQRAVEIVDGVLAERPDDTAALLLRVRAHLHYNEFAAAHALLERLQDLGERSKGYYESRIHALAGEGRYDEALDVADDMFDESGGVHVLHPLVYICGPLLSGFSLRDLQTHQEVERRVAERWLLKSPGSVRARQMLASLKAHLAEDLPAHEREVAQREALDLARTLVEEDPDDPVRQKELARIAVDVGAEDAVAQVKRAVELGVGPDQIGFGLLPKLQHPAVDRLRRLALQRLSGTQRALLAVALLLPAILAIQAGWVKLGVIWLLAAILFELMPLVVRIAETYLWSRDPVLGPFFRPRPLSWARSGILALTLVLGAMLCLPFVPPKLIVPILIAALVPVLIVGIESDHYEVLSPAFAWTAVTVAVLTGGTVFLVLVSQ